MRTRVLLIVSLLIAAPSAVWACMNAVLLEGDDATKQIKQAETLLAKGKLDKAARLVDEWRYRFADEGLQRQADIVRSTIEVRRPARQRDKYRVERALDTLGKLHVSHKEDPLIAARFAESLALDETRRELGRQLLEDLTERDLMPDAYAYLALARFRQDDKDEAGSVEALASCRKMTRDKRICRLEIAAPTKKAQAAKAAARD